MNYFKDSEIKFYHKIQIPQKYNNHIFITSRCYKLSLNSLKVIIDDSLKDVIDSCPNSYTSHFINIFAKKNGDTIILDKDNFLEVNHIMRDAISNKYKYLFVDNKPF